MPLKQKFLLQIIIIFLVSIACSGVGSSPPDTPAPAPESTFTPAPGHGPAQPGNLETATVAKVVDGDTIELTDGRRIRYIGINTPERDQPYYQDATEANRQLVADKDVQLEYDVEQLDKYGRTLAYIWVDGVMTNIEIVNRGFANAFTVPPNVKYEDAFRQAEREAREAGRGLWAGSDVALKIIHIEADAPGSDKDNPNGEWVEIGNQGNEAVQMQGYTLKDEANHIYTFGDFVVQPGATFQIYSGQGDDSRSQLYWGLFGESIWNNNGDTAFLRDAQGALIDTFAY